MQTDHNLADLDALTERFFSIDTTTYGNSDQPFIIRYNGNLINNDSENGFNQIADAFDSYNITPILKQDGNIQTLHLFPKITKRAKKYHQLNFLMFLLTLLSVLFTGGLYSFKGALTGNTIQIIWTMIKSGWPFAISLLAILSGHEFGHYIAGKINHVDVTLPFFIPFPFSAFGTMGAFISMRSLPRNKKVLFDIAISGPLSGLLISIIVLLIGLNLSEVHTLPLAGESVLGMQMEGNSLLYLLLKYISFGKLLPNLLTPNGFSLAANWFQYFFTGVPFPWGAQDVLLHPVAWAGWAGLFVTAINLLPVGQLDGGHIFQTVFGRKLTQNVFPIIIGALALLGIFWRGWWGWVVILLFTGRRYAEPLDQVTQLDHKRKWLGYLAIFIFLITFIPVPITIING
jgi:membrane-associated protease RseP (regulator of RpoE activity)